MCDELQENSKCSLSRSTNDAGVAMFNILNIFTQSPEALPKSCKSLTIFGVEMRGEVINISRSPANKAHLCVHWPHLTP